MSAAPLVLTLGLDEASSARFEALRREHFPPARNVLAAHLTLFHALPGELEDAVAETVQEVAAGAPGPLQLRCDRVIRLGRGVALGVDGPGLAELRAKVAWPFEALLTPQDARRHRPHVTVQNKVEPAVAKALHARLSEGFAPFGVRGEALRLWRYLGGPWEHVLDAPLGG